MFISEFRFWWPEVRSLPRPDHIRQWENVQMPFFSERTNVLSILKHAYIGPFSMIHRQCWPIDLSSSGHSRTCEVKFVFFSLTFDRIEIELWEGSQSVSFATTHRMICNMIYLAQHVPSRDLHLRSNFEMSLFRPTCTYFDAFLRKEHDAAKIMSLAFFGSKFIREKTFLQKSVILTFLDLNSLIRWS